MYHFNFLFHSHFNLQISYAFFNQLKYYVIQLDKPNLLIICKLRISKKDWGASSTNSHYHQFSKTL